MAVVAVKTTARVMGMSFIIPPNFEKIANGSSQANSYFIVSKTLDIGTSVPYPILRHHKSRSKLKQLLKVLAVIP
jgi:hypothetical protein